MISTANHGEMDFVSPLCHPAITPTSSAASSADNKVIKGVPKKEIIKKISEDIYNE